MIETSNQSFRTTWTVRLRPTNISSSRQPKNEQRRSEEELRTSPIHLSVYLPMENTNDGASPTQGQGDKQRKSKTKPPPKPLPPSICEITIDNADCLVIDQVPAPPKEEDKEGTMCHVLIAVKPRNGLGEPVLIESLDALQIRKLAMNLGINMASHNRKWKNLREMAQAAATYKGLKNHRSSLGSKEISESEELLGSDLLQHNTVSRLANVLFSEAHVQNFLTLNDARDRKAQEMGMGPKAEEFWKSVATEFEIRDGMDVDDPYGSIDLFKNDEDPRIPERMKGTEENPSNYVATSSKLLEEWTKLLVKVRELIKYRMS
jgi:hypothetical protein